MKEETKRKIAAGVGIVAGLIALLISRKKGVPPPPPGRANLYGKVTDALTGQPIEGIEVSLAEYASVTETNGYYLIEGITPGGYEVTFHDPLAKYEPLVL